MKEIKLTQGKIALVDDEDFDGLNRYKWHAKKSRNTFYAMRKDNPFNRDLEKTIVMHRVILNVSDTIIKVDHKDHNGLNNQKNNLRQATPAQNTHNTGSRKNSTSKYKGVSYRKKEKLWISQIRGGGRKIYLGAFKKETDAAEAYNKAALIYHGEFANLNIIATKALNK